MHHPLFLRQVCMLALKLVIWLPLW